MLEDIFLARGELQVALRLAMLNQKQRAELSTGQEHSRVDQICTRIATDPHPSNLLRVLSAHIFTARALLVRKEFAAVHQRLDEC